ncbi:nose resistant to fluoxetine protein 6-like [Chironomus tepperi]|uniref:nose resistant to fluoxetine protein 6-like n=1 Tax=Chironomus tepperi TaxID=113505 RepID=UPI00391F4666
MYQNFQCLQHTWYLAAEFQLFVIGLLIIVLIKRFQRFGIFIATVCFIVPAVWTVCMVHPFFPGFLTPESGRFLFRDNLFYLKYHLPTYANFDNYFVGLLGSLLYKNTKINQSKLFIKYYHMICFVSVSIYAVGQVIIYMTNFEKSSLLFTIFLTESRKLWGFSLIILIIGCHVNKTGNLAAKVLNWKVTVLLGKINLEVYLLHMLIMYTLQYGTGQPIRATTMESVKYNVSSIFLTYVVSFIIHVFVLLPYRKIIKLFT